MSTPEHLEAIAASMEANAKELRRMAFQMRVDSKLTTEPPPPTTDKPDL